MKTLSPAEKLAKKKPWRRAPRNSKYVRKITWVCRLREIREALRLSLDDAALGIGLSKTAYWQLEQGTDPMLTTASRVAMFFGRTMNEIWVKLAA
jgi:DNA-binding XRE family transcriptional regulator